MKKTSLAIALAFASMGAAQAQDMSNATYGNPAPVPVQADPAQPAPSKARFFVGMGFTGGGEKIATVEYTDGDDGDVTFGSLIQMGGGVDYRINQDLSLQASIHTHISSEGADNGAIRFTRMPIELLGYYNVTPQWRLGVGARYVSSAKIKSRGVANIGNFSFDNTVGAIVEAEYALGERVGIKLRYVSEKYQLEGSSEKLSGNHVGIFGNFYF